MNEQQPEYPTKQTIFRVEKSKDNPFVMMDRRPLEKPYLSWKAKGLLAYLLSRPDNWVINFGDLVKRSTDGEHATRAAAHELINARHIKVEKERDEKGKIVKWTYTVYEQPLPENQQVGNPDVGNRNINDSDIKGDGKNNEEEAAPTFGDAWSFFQNNINPTPNQFDAQAFGELCDEHTPKWVIEAMKIAVKRGARNIAFFEAVLKRWKVDGYGTEMKKNGNGRKPAGKSAFEIVAEELERRGE